MRREKVREVAGNFGSRLLRTKHIAKGDLTTQLKRCLNTFDLAMLGIGHMIGAGIFVTTGEVMRKMAGPSTVLSYAVSGIAALLSALCYAEFGARYPKAGSAYTYAYVGVGELWAFIIGWNIVLEHCLSAAAVGRTFSGYADELVNGAVRNWTTKSVPWFDVSFQLNATDKEICKESELNLEDMPIIAKYPDFISVGIVLISAVFIGIGSKATSNCNSVFSIANIVVIVAVVGYGVTFANFGNWENFFPCGVNGVLAGASKCFFAYIGFDGLATAGEEAKDPARMIPRATYWAMGITTVVYILMAGILSLMLPYYDLSPTSVYARAFTDNGAPYWVGTVIAIGAMLGILTSLIGSLFALPRAVYAMADDGLIFGWWAKVHEKTQTPLNAIITFTLLTALISMLFDLDALVDFLSIGTILAYSIVAASLMLLRYRPHPRADVPSQMDEGGRIRPGIPILSNLMYAEQAGHSVLYAILVMIAAMTLMGVLISTSLFKTSIIGSIVFGLSVVFSIGSVLFVHAHQQNSMDLDYKVALVPYLPSASLFVNILMMTQLTMMTWIRMVVWMAIGLAIYFAYGLRHSKEEGRWREERRRKRQAKNAPPEAWSSPEYGSSDLSSSSSGGAYPMKDWDAANDFTAPADRTSSRSLSDKPPSYGRKVHPTSNKESERF